MGNTVFNSKRSAYFKKRTDFFRRSYAEQARGQETYLFKKEGRTEQSTNSIS
jgi:hypothetical protein